MQLGTLAAVTKIIFGVVVVAILIYLAVKRQDVRLGKWRIDGSDENILKFISPANNVVFAVNQKDHGIVVKNYLIKGDEYGLQFFSPKIKQMARMTENEFFIGDLGILDKTGDNVAANRGVQFLDTPSGKVLATVSADKINWPQIGVAAKAVREGDKVAVEAADTRGKRGLFPDVHSAARYNII